MTEIPQEVIDAIAAGNFVVCRLKCWPCQFGQCPGGPHGWADADDIEHAAKTGQPDPSEASCGCPCVNDAPREPDGPDSDDYGPGEVPLSSLDPCSECGEMGACAWDSEGRPMVHVPSEGGDD